MRDIKEIISKLTVEEKASLCCGGGFWDTYPIEKYDIPAINLTDGPHGVRKQVGEADHLGLNASYNTTCFPTASALASSWNREIINNVGSAIGEEAHEMDVQVVLGPGANIKRSPLCGRNFEYYSEDPYLAGELAAEHINGLQSQNIGSSLKHFAVNNQETRRFNINAIVDERTLREIYLCSFEGAVKKSQPMTVMAAYNQINGEYCSQNKKLLTDILKNEWGFEGLVVSDWFAVCERELGVAAGLDLEMPTSAGVGKKAIVDAINNGTLSIDSLNNSVERILKVVFRTFDNKKLDTVYDRDAHHELAIKAATESMVLLKNEENILPLNKSSKISVIGEFAKTPRYQGAGSSHINSTKIDIPFDEISKNATTTYADGLDLENAKAVAKNSDVSIIFAGLPDKYDAEGTDRKHMQLPEEHTRLIEAIASVQKNVVVVLINGSAVEMPWVNEVKGIFEIYLTGQGMGSAISKVLFGDVNPSGKLAETFPVRLQDTPSYLNFPGEIEKVEYREGLFVGYRYYDKTELKPLFPFGFGLSYTTFEYSNLKIDKEKISDTETLNVTVNVKNTGKVQGKEIVQLYVHEIETSVVRPIKELKGFEKISLEVGEEKTVSFELNKRSFAFYDDRLNDWTVKSGKFEILVGKSSAEILLKETVEVQSTKEYKKPFTLDSTLLDIKNVPAAAGIMQMFGGAAEGGTALGMDVDGVLSSIKIRSLVPMSAMKGDGNGMTIEQVRAFVDSLNVSQ